MASAPGASKAAEAAGASAPHQAWNDDLLFAGGLAVHALRKRDGAIVWSTQAMTDSTHSPISLLPHPPAHALLAVVGKALHCIDTRDGSMRWGTALDRGLYRNGYTAVPGITVLAMEPGSAVGVGSSGGD
ncbi:hypothetical protein HK405_000887, partial [Cladochytrium tenue]